MHLSVFYCIQKVNWSFTLRICLWKDQAVEVAPCSFVTRALALDFCGLSNSTSLFDETRIELRALGKISPGEELTVSYIDFLNVSEDRRKQLKKQYYFDCTCEHCQKKIKDDLMLAVKEGEHKVRH